MCEKNVSIIEFINITVFHAFAHVIDLWHKKRVSNS
jgi:hypothetical protein